MMAKEKTRELLIIEAKNFFNSHKKELGEAIRKGNNVILVDFMKLSEFSTDLSNEIISNTELTLYIVIVTFEDFE